MAEVKLFAVDDWNGFGEQVDEADNYRSKHRGSSDDRFGEEQPDRQPEGCLCALLHAWKRGCFDSEVRVACLFLDLLAFLAEYLQRPGLTHSETQYGQYATNNACYHEDLSPIVVVSTQSIDISEAMGAARTSRN